MTDNLNTYTLNMEMNDLYDQIESFLEDDFDFLMGVNFLEEGDEVDVRDDDWRRAVVSYYERQNKDEYVVQLNKELEEYIALSESLGDETWGDNTELIHEDNAGDVGEEFVINSVVIDYDTMNYIRPHIDFEAIGEEILNDYESVGFRGETYYYQQQ